MGPRSQYINNHSKGIHMNTSLSRIPQFNNKPIRDILHEGKVYYSVVDALRAVLQEERDASNNWSLLKRSDNQLLSIIQKFKFMALDGKMRETDCATEIL